jgi:hypothetical protein
MDEIINIKVNGNSVTKDYNVAGTQYEANRTKLRISFSENWSGYAKSVTFWNAVGENPVKLLLGTDLLENILENDSVYIVPIPGEAMTEGGKCSFVIEGAKDGVNARTVEDSLKVLYSPKADNAGQAVDPTPTQAEQLRAEMDAVMDDIASAKEAANEASDAVEEVRNMSVSCETLDVGATPTVDKSFDDGKVNLHFGIPTSVEGVHIGEEAPTDPHVKVWIDTSGEPDQYVTVEEQKLALSDYTKKIEFEAVVSDVEGIQQAMNGESHFRGYVSTNAKVQATEATPNDFAYSAESGTKWVYDAELGWQDTGTPVPDQLTPASDATPLVNGIATPGESNEYARGDHRHPTDTTRVGFTDYATKEKAGAVKVRSKYGTGCIADTGELFIVAASETDIDARISKYAPVVPTNLEYAVKSVGDGYYATMEQIGDIEAALDAIIAMQNELIGGASE